jgi:hypothetical protein
LCRGQCTFMAVHIQFATDGAGECFVHTDTFNHRQLETERKSGHSSPRLKAGLSWPHGR